MKLIAFVVLLGISAAQANFDFTHDWHALRVSWYANPLSSWGFDKLPRTIEDAESDFTMKDNQCAGEGNKFVGQRYWYKEDPAVILLFDKNGIIAGIQSSVQKNRFTPDPKSANKYFIDDGDYWTMTAYFVDPKTVCSQGRTADDLKQGTGTGLWLQYGNNAVTDSISIPLNEEDVKKTLWGHGKCFYTMGQHYWFNISKTMECGDVAPNCLLYNKGKLTGFCFAPNYYVDSSSRYDSPAPTIKVLSKFLDPVPDCFYSDPSFQKQSTVHVYFNEKPQLTSWC